MTNYLIDTHCHLHDQEFYRGEKEQVYNDSLAAGVKKMITIGTSVADSLDAIAFADKHQGVFCSYGVHPEYADREEPDAFPAKPHKIVAIGEVGLDYHFSSQSRQAQIKLLENMLQLAIDNNLPLIFHVREAFADFWPVLDNFSLSQGAVLHSFSDNQHNLEQGLKRGFYIGVNGLKTFANLPTAPLERTLLETDAPYLTPVPFRGKINKPAYVLEVAKYLARQHQVPLETIIKTTTQNAETLFNL